MSTSSGAVRRSEFCDVFISHIHEEAPLAEALKRVLQGCLPGWRVWASSEDIAPGEQWAQELNKAMEAAKLILVLCSSRSIRAAWVNFEAGAGWGKEVKVVPVCHGDLALSDLTWPLNGFQSRQLATADDLLRLVATLQGTPPGDLGAAWAAIEEATAAIDYVPRAQRPLSRPTAARGVLMDLAHGQAAWPRLRRGTVFSWPTDRVAALTDLDVEIGTIAAADQVRAADLGGWQGAVLALPSHRRLSEGSIEQIVTWVRAGGRLALLGFELGDLHHEANLNELASRFALRFNGDALAPAGWEALDKPYGKNLALTPTSDHPLFVGVESLTWRNVQTLAHRARHRAFADDRRPPSRDTDARVRRVLRPWVSRDANTEVRARDEEGTDHGRGHAVPHRRGTGGGHRHLGAAVRRPQRRGEPPLRRQPPPLAHR